MLYCPTSWDSSVGRAEDCDAYGPQINTHSLLALAFPGWGLTQLSIPLWVSEVGTSNEGDWWNMCIPNSFTVPRGSLVACMLPRKLRWEKVAPHHKGMIQLKVPVLRSYKLHVKRFW